MVLDPVALGPISAVVSWPGQDCVARVIKLSQLMDLDPLYTKH